MSAQGGATRWPALRWRGLRRRGLGWPAIAPARGREIVLVLGLLFVYGSFQQTPVWNENSRFDLVRAIVEQGTTRIDAYHENTGDKAFFEGHYYSDKPPGSALIGVPVYAALRVLDLAAGAGEPEPRLAVQALAFIESGVATALLVLLLLRFLRPVVGETWALVVAAGYGLGSMAFPFATMFFGHAASTFFLFAAFYQLWRWRSDPRDWRPVLAGFLAGCGVVTEYPVVLGVAALGLYALWLGRATALRFVLGGLPLALVLGAYDWVSFGDPFRIGYQFSTTFSEQNRQGLVSVVWPSLGRAVDLLAGPRGLLHLAPWFALVPLGLGALRDRAVRAEVVAGAAICVAFLTFNSGALNPFGGWTPGPRYLMPALPFAAILVALAHPRWRPLAGGLMALGTAVFVTATATMPNAPEGFRAPLSELWIPRLLGGEIGQTLAWLRWGLAGSLPLVVLAGAALAVVAALVATFRRRAPVGAVVMVTAVGLLLLTLLVSPFLPLQPAGGQAAAGPGSASGPALAIRAAGVTPVPTDGVRAVRVWAQVENTDGTLGDTRIVFRALGPSDESAWTAWYGDQVWRAGERRTTSLEWDTRAVPPGTYRMAVSIEAQASEAVLVERDAGTATVGAAQATVSPDDLLAILLVLVLAVLVAWLTWHAPAGLEAARAGLDAARAGSRELRASFAARVPLMGASGIELPPWLDRVRTRVSAWASPYAFALILLSGLAIRVILAWVAFPGEGHASDLRFFESWAGILGQEGLVGPQERLAYGLFGPGLLWVLWLLGSLGHVVAAAIGAAPADVIAALVKLPAITADLLIAGLLFRAVTAWEGRRAGLVAAGLYLLLPATWYESAVWGQVDAIGTVFVLGAVILVVGGWSEAAAASAIAATMTKPQFAIALVVVGAVLLRRHLLQPGSGPIPALSGRLAALDRSLGRWFTRRQGPERLLASAAAGLLVGIALILPFRYAELARVSGAPIASDIAGWLSFVSRQAALAPMLTVNAFNPWALVGPEPLIGAVGHWTRDSLVVLGGLDALTVGALLFAALAAGVAWQLLLVDDRARIVLAATVLALGLFVLPTRVHERYAFAALALAAPLAATSLGWRVWYLALSAAFLANLHAVLTISNGQFGSPGIVALPLGDALRGGAAVGLVIVTMTALLGTSVWGLLSGAMERTRAAYGSLRARWPLRQVLPDAGTALLIVLGVALLLRVLWLNLPQGALIFDEAYYVNAARVILGIHPAAGAHYADAPLFLDPNTEHPPLGKVLIAGSMALLGDNGLGWRVPSLIAGLVALAALYGIVRALGGRPWLGVLAVGLYSLDILSFVHGRIGTLDMMSVGFLLVGAWLALRERWLLAGAALALGTLIKVPGVYGFVAVLVWEALALWRISRHERLTRPHFVPVAALTGAYALVGLVGLWLLDLRFTDYPTPLDHVARMLSYGLALQGGFSPSGITSAPWQWLVNEGQFDYLKTAVNTLSNGQVIGSRTIVEFRALLNPVLIGSASLAVLYGAWVAWKRGEALATWGLIWIGANYLPFWALALFANRITYFYYVLPAVPGLALLTAGLLVHARLPRLVVWGYLLVSAVAFVAWFPFRQVP